jgi:hypothetical protein
MHRFWDKIIEPIFLLEKPKTIVEIGAWIGLNTNRILNYCQKHGSQLYCIDPMPQFDVREYNTLYKGHFRMMQDLSLNALPKIENCDAVLIDGDPNWYTVYNELKLIEKMALSNGKFPNVFIHDIEWPYARRDMYHFPETIPQEFRKPYATKGIIRRQSALAETGGLNPHMNNALYEGGEKNGVLTAVEDFLRETPIPIQFARLRSHFGLGILFEPHPDKIRNVEQIIQNVN